MLVNVCGRCRWWVARWWVAPLVVARWWAEPFMVVRLWLYVIFVLLLFIEMPGETGAEYVRVHRVAGHSKVVRS